MKASVAIATYICLWWTLLFATLPFGVRTQEEDGAVVPGTPESAPSKMRIWRVIALNTVITTIVFAGVYAVIAFRLISLD